MKSTEDIEPDVKKLNVLEKKKRIREIFASIGKEIHNPDVGTIGLTNQSANDEAWHLRMTGERLAAIKNLRQIVETAKPVYYDANHKGNSKDTITLASKIRIGDENYYSLTTVRVRENTNTHRFELIDGALEKATNEKEGARTQLLPPLLHDGAASKVRALHDQSIFNLLNGRNIEADDALELRKEKLNSKTESNDISSLKVAPHAGAWIEI